MFPMETKFHLLQPWLHEILDSIRRDIKTDYLPASREVYRTHFGNRPLNRLTAQEIYAALSKELLQGNQDLAEWVVNRWVFKHGELYSHFAEKLGTITPDFGALKGLTEKQSEQMLEGARELYGVKSIYFFSVLNEVVLAPAVLQTLRQEVEAQKELSAPVSSSDTISEEEHQKAMARITEKYEQKMAGILKKYTADVESLKSQVRALQKRVG